MKRHPFYLSAFVVLLAMAASADSSSPDTASSPHADSTAASAYTLPADLATWLQQPDETPVKISDLQHVAATLRDFLNQALVTQGGAGADIDDLVSGFGSTSPDFPLGIPASFDLLRQIAEPFYTRLLAVGDTSQADSMAQGIGANSTTNFAWPQPPAALGDAAYSPTVSADWTQRANAPITLGQLKEVFNLGGDTSSFLVVDSGFGASRLIMPGAKKGTTDDDGTQTSGDSDIAKNNAEATDSTLKPAVTVTPLVLDNSQLGLIVLTPLE